MKAMVCTRYGGPEVLQLQERPKPVPKDNEIRVRIQAASITPSDCAFRKANPFMIRFLYGLRRPKYPVLGVELSGEVESIGKDVQLFKVGDQVYGISPRSFGTYAEYKCLPETQPITLKPVNMSNEEAVAICDGALTALTFLRDVAKIQRGHKILINGSSGAVGAYAVQLAKIFGAEVTGVCSKANGAFVKSLGADKVVDYNLEDFNASGQRYDVIFDAVGKSSYSRCKRSLSAKGVYLTTVPTLSAMLQMIWTSKSKGTKVKFVAAGLQQNKENLQFLKKLAEEEKIKPVIDRCYALEQIAEAHRYVEKGHKKGNVVISFTAKVL
ncbi:NAD(P)-dependent alcohol dehydrogenase [Paenibacillus sp. sgz500958]|uniref:NAD(P)-dependent alcohol dehydrogenase n=1 Tax=Paenibacillus sp. sgz500958 TaxID=3242475 RepID=UPI0036D29FC4